MGIPNTVQKFLERHGMDYTVVPHPYTETSMETAEAAHVSGLCLLKKTTLPSRTAKAGASAARAAVASVPKDLRPARSADRA